MIHFVEFVLETIWYILFDVYLPNYKKFLFVCFNLFNIQVQNCKNNGKKKKNTNKTLKSIKILPQKGVKKQNNKVRIQQLNSNTNIIE